MKRLTILSALLIAAPAMAVSPERPHPQLDFNKSVAGMWLGFEGDTYPAVEAIDANSAAAKAGLHVGDRVISLDGRIAAFMGQDELRAILVSQSPAKVKVEINRAGEGKDSSQNFILTLAPAKELADQHLAARLLDTSPFYPEHKEPLKAGYYAIDLPSFLRYEAGEGPLLIEFYDKKDGKVEKLVGRYNSMILHKQVPDTPQMLVSLISLPVNDSDTEPLRKHFRIERPSLIFVPGADNSIKDFVDVVRHGLSDEELFQRLRETALTREVGENMMQVVRPEMAARWREITNAELNLPVNRDN